MEKLYIHILTNEEIRELLMECRAAPPGFVITRNDYVSIRALARKCATAKEDIGHEEAIRRAFYCRMKHVGRLEEAYEALSKAEQEELIMQLVADDFGCGERKRAIRRAL